MKLFPLFKPNYPFAPSKFPFFYGWVIVIFTTLGTVASIPGQTMGVGVFTDYLISITKLNRMQISIAYMIGTIASSLLIPISGRFVDLLGTRFMIFFAGIGMGISLVLFSETLTLISFFESRLPSYPSSLIGMFVMTVIFLLLRQFGQGQIAMVSRITLSKWFDKRRGLASGISGLFIALSFSGAPLFLNKTIDLYGHSKSMVIMAIIFGFGIAALGWFFYRDNPEECGLIMDGKKIFSEKSAFATEEPETTLKEALNTYNFWIFSIGLCSASLIITGFTFHISSIGALAGLSRFESYSIFLPIALISMISHFIAGWASDRMPLKYILIVMLFGLALGSIGMSNLNTVSCRVLVIFGFGLQGGIWPCLFTVTWPRFYGRKYLGSISGLVMGAQVFASAIGPPVFGLSQNIYGSYSPIAIFLTGFNLLLIIGAFRAVSYYRG